MQKKAVLFDFDGTVADSVPWIVSTINKLAPEFGFKPISDDEFESLRQYTLLELIKKFHIPLYRLPFYIMQTRTEVTKVISEMGLCEGIETVLLQLKSEGYRLGIVSSSPLPNIESFVTRQNMTMFEFIHSELNIFGKSMALQKVLKQYDMKKEEVLYVGDEIRDIEACNKIGLDVVGVTWGFNNEESLKAHGAVHIAHIPQDILRLLTEDHS